MSTAVSARLSVGARLRSVFFFAVPTLLALAMMVQASSVSAQQLPNVSADQMQQLQQQFGRGGQNGSVINAAGDNTQQNTTLQPAVPGVRADGPPSRLEQILSTRAGASLRQFGYDQLGSGRSVTIPQSGALQDDYILGPGDEIVISLRGQENSEFRTTVSRDGQVVIPRVNPIPATGRSFGDFRADVEAAVRRTYVATNAYVSIGRVRQISVLVSGEVNNPGQRTLTGLSSAVDALLLSGGVRKTGSLRNIRILRNGRAFTLDLYSVLTSGGAASSMRLADGDRVVVPLLGATVAISGLVRQPGIYELPARTSSISVDSLMRLAGGQEIRGNYRLSVLRIDPDGRSNMQLLSGQTGVIRDSEILFVQLAADQTTSRATLSGGSTLAGAFPVIAGSKLSEMIRQPGALGDAPYTLFGIVARRDPRTLLRTLVPFTPVAVMSGSEDQRLETGDIVRPLSLKEIRLIGSTVREYVRRQNQVQEALRNPLSAPSSPGRSGGFGGPISSSFSITERGSNEALDIQIIGDLNQNKLDMLANGQPLYPVTYGANRPQGAQNPNSPGGQQQNGIGRQDGQMSAQQSDQEGPQDQPLLVQPERNPVFSPGQGAPLAPQTPDAMAQAGQSPGADPYAAYGNDMTQNSFQQRASGYQDPADPSRLAANRDAPTFNILAQQLGVTPLVLVNFLIDHQAMIDGAVHGPGAYFVGPGASLQDLIQAAGGTASWADESGVELISTVVDPATGRSMTRRERLPLREGLLASYSVKPRDQFHFNQVFTDNPTGSVTVQGEVRYGGTFQITRGERLSEVLASAGGLTSSAYPSGTVFLRKSTALQERASYVRAAKEIEEQMVVAMTRVGNDKLSPETFTSMQSFVNDLRNQRAVGRISIVADPSVLASRPELDPMLEAGDIIYIPPRPSTVSVLGQVMQPGAYPYRAGRSVKDYIAMAGGYSPTSDSSNTYIVFPDGSARKMDSSFLNFSSDRLTPGSTVVVPRDVTPLDLRQTIIDVSQILSQLAVSIASVAVISRY